MLVISSNEEPFFNIPLNLSSNLESALDDYVAEQILSEDNMYNTEQFGPQAAKKSVRFLVVPPIIMIQLKRFQFNYNLGRNQKMLQRFQYPKVVDFSRWQVSSDGANHYELYAVLVHEGLKAQSGHYFAFVQIGEKWFKFNDQEVSEASVPQVFDFNFGGSIEVLDFDARQMRVINKTHQTSSTAYMLVYVKSELKQQLLNSEPVYPNWLREHEIQKQEEREETKNRRNYYHDVQALHWDTNFLDTRADYLGLIPKHLQQFESQDLGKVEKAAKVEQWVLPYNQRGVGVYLYLTTMDKIEYEVLVNLQHRKGSLQEVIREPACPIVLLMLPLITQPEHYLYAVKLLTPVSSVNEEGQATYQPHIRFHDLLQISRNSKNGQLLRLLRDKYEEEGYTLRYYYEEKKDLTEIRDQNTLVRGPVMQRNILGIIIVEKCPVSAVELQDLTVRWYADLKNCVEIVIKSEDGKYEFAIEVDQNRSVQSLRQQIFCSKLQQDQNYLSADNIVLKTKPKKAAKVFIECIGAQTIRDLIKNCQKQNLVVFGYSGLRADQRVNQLQLRFIYRFQDFTFSQPFHVVFDRKSLNESENIYLKIAQHPQVRAYSQQEDMPGIRLLLLTKERNLINHIVLENGYVHGKGELASVLQKEKGCQLAVQGFPSTSIDPAVCPLLLSHRSQSGDRIGSPRYLEFPRQIKLTDLHDQLLSLVQDEVYDWEDKKIKCNPMKVVLFAYAKDQNKGVYLNDQPTLRELHARENGSQPANQLKGIQEQSNVPIDKVEQDVQALQISRPEHLQEGTTSVKVVDLAENPGQQPMQASQLLQAPRNEQGQESQGSQSGDVVQIENPSIHEATTQKQHGGPKLQEWEKTISCVFPRAKCIKVVLSHLYICKATVPMRINLT